MPDDAVEPLAQLAERCAIPVVAHNRAHGLPAVEPSDAFRLRAGRAARPTPISSSSLESDVPWIPHLQQPPAGCRVAHIGEDPVFARYPMRSFPSDLAIQPAPRNALAALDAGRSARACRWRRRASPPAAQRLTERMRTRRAQLAKDRARRRQDLAGLSEPRASARRSAPDAVIFNEYPLRADHCAAREARHAFRARARPAASAGASARRSAPSSPRPTSSSSPRSATAPTCSPIRWPATGSPAAHDLPILTIIFNNSRYGAVRNATLSMFKDGAAGENDGRMLADLDPAPAYDALAAAQGAYAERVEKPADLPDALDRAREAVMNGPPGAAQRHLSVLKAPMPTRLLGTLIIILRAAIIVAVAGWILDVPGRLQIGLFNEQILVAVLGISLALTFLTFPLLGRTGEEAVAEKVITKQIATAGWIDFAFAVVALLCCFYVAIRYQSLIVELVARPAYGVALSTVIVLLVCEASRRVTGLALVVIVRRAVRACSVRLHAAGNLRQPAGRAQPADGLSRHRHQCTARRSARHRGAHRHAVRRDGSRAVAMRRLGFLRRYRGLDDGPLPRRLGQDRRGRLGVLRHDVGQRRRQCRQRRHHHHPADEARRFFQRNGRGDRSRRLDRRPGRAAGDGRRRLPDGRISAGALWHGGDRRDHSGAAVLCRAADAGRSGVPPSSASKASRARACRRSGGCCATAGNSWCRSSS